MDGSPTALLARLPLPAVVFGPKSQFVRTMREAGVKYGTAARLRLADDSIDGFYASHVLEHIRRAECIDLLKRVRPWLKSDARIRIVLPDLRLFAEKYLHGDFDTDRFVENTGLAVDGMQHWQLIFGHSYHRWMYDADSFSGLLTDLGYRNVHRTECAETEVAEFAELDRFYDRASDSFYIEASIGE